MQGRYYSREYEERLLKFYGNHKRVYLYGAGLYGKVYFSFFQEKGLEIAGFITTDGGGELYGKRIFKASAMASGLDSGSGVILSVNEDNQREMRENISFPCDVFAFTNMEFARFVAPLFTQDKFYSKKRWEFQKKITDYHWERILAVQLEVTFGDMVWSTAFYRELRRNFPKASITLVMNQKFAELYSSCPYIDEILLYDCSTLNDCISQEMVQKVEEYAKKNLSGDYDVVFLPRLQPLTFSDAWENILLAQESGSRYRIAHALYMTEENRFRCGIVGDMFSVIVKHRKAEHEVQYDLQMLQVFSGEIADERMELWLSHKDTDYAENALECFHGRGRIPIAVALVGSTGTRSWDPAKYGCVFQRLERKHGGKPLYVLCGGSDAVDAAEVVKDFLQEDSCLDVIGRTSLTEAAAIVSRCVFYVGSDTGLMHMASAFGLPVIELSASIADAPAYWGSSPTRTGPWMVPSIVLRPERGLDGCRYMCHRKTAHCINQITEKQVEDAMEEMLCLVQK